MRQHITPFLLQAFQFVGRHRHHRTVTGKEILAERLRLLGERLQIFRPLELIAARAIEVIHQDVFPLPLGGGWEGAKYAAAFHMRPRAGVGVDILEVFLVRPRQLIRRCLLNTVLDFFAIIIFCVAFVEKTIDAVLVDNVVVDAAVFGREQYLRRQLDQRLSALYAVEAQQEHLIQKEADEIEEPSIPEETAQQKAINQRNKEFLDKLDHLIISNLLKTDLDVNFIAEQLCMSYSTLHRRIKSLTGMTANEYIRKHRLAKAMQLLRSGVPATEVAMECGFNSPSYFTRCFKAEYGVLPSEV